MVIVSNRPLEELSAAVSLKAIRPGRSVQRLDKCGDNAFLKL